MLNQHHHFLMRLLVFTGVLLFAFCSGKSIRAQAPLPGAGNVPRISRAPNPKVNLNHVVPKRLAERAGKNAVTPKLSAEAEKLQAIEEAITLGNQARDGNDYEEAFSQYRKAEELNPKDVRAYYGLGNVYSDLSCNDSAIDSYLKALKIRTGFRDVLLALGYVYAAKERYDDAEEQFRAVLDRSRNDAEARIGLGYLFSKKGNYQEAITQLNLVINDKAVAAKDRASAHVTLGGVYQRLQRPEAAIAQFESAIGVKPDLALAYLLLGNAQLSSAFSKLAGFESVDEISNEEREALVASAKRAAINIEKAKEDKEHPYNHPNIYEFLALALAYQSNYQAAAKSIEDYFAEVRKLEARMKQVKGCDSGFNQLNSDGYWYLGFLHYLEGVFEPDSQRKTESFITATDQFNQAIKVKQDAEASYTMLSVISGRRKNFPEAISYLNKALLYATEQTTKAKLYRSLASDLSRIGQNDEAMRSVNRSISLDPNDPGSYETLASIYLGQNNLEETFKSLKKAEDLRLELGLQSSSNPSPYYYLGATYAVRFIRNKDEKDFAEAIRFIKKAAAIRPKTPSYYEGLGITYETHHDADEALANYQKAIEYDPKDPRNYIHMADVYTNLKHNDDAAMERLRKAIEVKPDSAEAHWHLGLVERRKSNDAEAIKEILEAIKYDPKFLQAYLDVAEIYKSRKEYPEAIKHLNAAIGIAPMDSKPYQWMGLLQQERGNADEALANFNKAIEYDPKRPENYLLLASFYSELQHDDDAATKQLLKAIEVGPDYFPAYFSLVNIYKSQKKYPEAVKLLTEAIKIMPKNFLPYKELAKVYEAQQENDKAIEYYEKARQLLGADDPATNSLYLGRIERLRGHYDAAIEYFKKVNYPEEPGQSAFEIGITYVLNGNKRAALAQQQQLIHLKSPLAGDLLKRINEMK